MTGLSVLMAQSSRSHAHAAVDGQAGAGDEAGRVGGEEHHRVGHVRDLAEAAMRGEADHGADALFQAREQPECHHVLGELVAHLGRDQARVNAVNPDSVTELAGFHGGHPGQPVDRGFGRGVDGDAGEGDGGGDRGDVDDGAATAGRAARAHGAEGVLEAERGAEDIDLEHLADVVRVQVDDQAGNLDPALLTRMSRPPSSRIASEIASSQLASSVTSSGRNEAEAPDFLSSSAVAWPRSSRMSPMTTAAPARARAAAIPAPRPRAPPVTRALRPVRSYTLMLHLLLETALAWSHAT